MKDGWKKTKQCGHLLEVRLLHWQGSKFLKSNTAHDLAVKGLAGGMKLKSDTTISMRQLRKTQRIY